MRKKPQIFLAKNLLQNTEFIYGISCRSLGNMSFKRGSPEEVVPARQKFLSLFDVSLSKAVGMEEIHGTKIYKVKDSDRGKGAFEKNSWIRGVDALITNGPGVFLFGTFADCLPILFFDPKTSSCGLAHAGWRGVIKNICSKVVKTMGGIFGCHPEDLKVYIGPSIHSCCFEVDSKVFEIFKNLSFGKKVTNFRGKKKFVDLQKSCLIQLIASGVKAENIAVDSNCTACNLELFFSHRKEAMKRGAMGAVIGIRE